MAHWKKTEDGARKSIAHIDVAISTCEGRISQYERVISSLREYRKLEEAWLQNRNSMPRFGRNIKDGKASFVHGGPRQGLNLTSWNEAVCEVLRESSEPMPVRKIYDALVAKGRLFPPNTDPKDLLNYVLRSSRKAKILYESVSYQPAVREKWDRQITSAFRLKNGSLTPSQPALP